MFKRLGAAFLVVCAVYGLSTAMASAAPNQAQQVAREVRSGFQAQLKGEAKQDQAKYPGLTFTVTAVTCVQVKTSESYKCLAYYALRYKTSVIKYKDNISAQVSGNKVVWQAHGGVPIG
jgi:hypothetical protein